MSVQMKVHKVNTLPGVLEASALYIVKSADTGLLDLYVSANDGLTARHIISKTEIQTMLTPLSLVLRTSSLFLTSLLVMLWLRPLLPKLSLLMPAIIAMCCGTKARNPAAVSAT